MKFSIQWLQEWLSSPIDPFDLIDKMTMSGLEVDAVNSAAPDFQKVVIGEVLSVKPHPDAQRLHCCQVNINSNSPLSIVCGANNVRPSLKVAVAQIGANLPKGIKIQSGNIRGQMSEGMLCGAGELGLSEAKGEGILELPNDAPVGLDLREFLQLDDQVIDVALTANRGDCLSIKGIAREAAVLLKNPFYEIEIKVVDSSSLKEKINIHLDAVEACPRYMGRIIKNINPHATIPIWMQERLRRSGLRCIHPVVDVTNYVMLELGQPLHAFDCDKLQGNVHIRYSQPGETITLLDGKQLTLKSGALVIADENQAQALAGIMGGMAASITSVTQNLFLESAFFSPLPLSLTARQYGLQTDSSYRFSRGVDYQIQAMALERATKLLLDIVGGEAGSLIEKVEPAYLPMPIFITLREKQIERLLGIQITRSEIVEILESLGMQIMNSHNTSILEVKVPSYRFDLTLEVDLIEELARIYGFQKIPSQAMNTPMLMPKNSAHIIPMSRILTLLMDRGYQEAITYSFVDPHYQQLLDPKRDALPLANPLSVDMSVMRTSLWPGLIKIFQYNQNRQMPRVRLFETGLGFLPTPTSLQQISLLGGIIGGNAYPEQWGIQNRPVDFFDVKGDVEALLALLMHNSSFNWQRSEHPALHPWQNASILWEGQSIGVMGALHPAIAEQLDLHLPIYLFELNLDALRVRSEIKFKKISKFPSIRRDIAITVNQEIPANKIQQFIMEKGGKLLGYVQIFDIYQGQNIEKGQKSIALGLTFQETLRTLKDEEIQTVIENLINSLMNEFNAKLRV